MAKFHQTTPFFGSNATFVEELYERYLQDPSSVDHSWQGFFADMGDSLQTVIRGKRGASWSTKDVHVIGANANESALKEPKANKPTPATSTQDVQQACKDSINALMLIRSYKVRGNLLCDLDPLGIERRWSHPDLDPATHGFSEADYDRSIFLGGALGLERATVREILDILTQTYASKIGVEFMHMPSLERRDWISSRMEAVRGKPRLAVEQKKTILEDMIKFEEFEQFLHKKFPGAKRFSAEGGEAVFAAVEKVIQRSAELGIKEVVIGMPHRGRLNMLTKVMGRRYASLLSEFQGKQTHFSEEIDATGDVKYHQGASSDREFEGKKIHLSLSANPSHLEAVDPVVVGRVRAKQDQYNDQERKEILGLLLHGDAAFCGQGVVAETLALSDLEGYTTGGVVHIIVNNQIGFTTSPKYSRKSPYPSDVAKGAHAPIFHVNGDDPEAVVFVSELALEFRQAFGVDVVVDVFCYRKYGHNEGDEPSFTQPMMYQAIKEHPSPMHVYAKQLIDEGVVTAAEFEAQRKSFLDFLESEFKLAQTYQPDEADWLKGRWKNLVSPERGNKEAVDTGVPLKKLKAIGEALGTYPKEHRVHPKLVRLMEAKKEMIASGKDLDWAMGEALAYGTLLAEGHHVRLSGQDSIRGTFSHRHSALIDQVTEARYFPLNNLGVKQGRYEVIDSNLSEYAVLGYEYGYSLADPNSLVLWEAQFGDFANGAQIMFDQFISCSEIKWLRFSGLVMLLPHGYEGQGPEHSSARLERFLQLCAQDNMQVVNCTTPANFFHVLRRQLHRNFRKPLVVMSPKSLLRHKLCVSDLSDFTPGTTFKTVIGETQKVKKDADIRQVVLCSGKVYYDLLDAREKQNITDIALIRVEQYYPFPEKELTAELKRYKNARVVWCQEEPENMGAWQFMDRRIEALLVAIGGKAKRPVYAGREEAAAPAAGYMKIHNEKQAKLIQSAFTITN